MSEIREQIIWKREFINGDGYYLTNFLKVITKNLSEIPDAFKNDSFIHFGVSEKFGEFVRCKIKIGYTRPETEEEKAVNDKLEEENEKRRYNRLKADFERLKAKFEKN